MSNFYGVLFFALICGCDGKPARSLESFIVHELVPDILSQPPKSLLSVSSTTGWVPNNPKSYLKYTRGSEQRRSNCSHSSNKYTLSNSFYNYQAGRAAKEVYIFGESVRNVNFASGVSVSEGNQLTIEEVKGVPVLSWGAEEGAFYTVIMCDADPPSRTNPRDRSFLHWLVINVQNDDVISGETIVDILNSNPEPDTGLHRYVFLVYKQTMRMTFEDPTPNATFEGRIKFSPEDFAAKNSLGELIAGNFYQTQNRIM